MSDDWVSAWGGLIWRQAVQQVGLSRVQSCLSGGQVLALGAAFGRQGFGDRAKGQRVTAKLGRDLPARDAVLLQEAGGAFLVLGDGAGAQDLDIIQQYPGDGVSCYGHRRFLQVSGGDRMRRKGRTFRRDPMPRLRLSADVTRAVRAVCHSFCVHAMRAGVAHV